MSLTRYCLAVAAGVVLATVPFWRYVHLGGPGEPHADHAARHGGQLGMVGDHHIELRRRPGKVEAFVSDAWRRSVRPRAAWVVFDRAATAPLQWENHRLVGKDQAEARDIETVVILSDGTRLAISFAFEGAAHE